MNPLPDARSDPGDAAHDEQPKEDHSEEQGHEDELRADLRHPNLDPRTHVLGGEGATWGGVDVGTDGYKRGEGVDIRDVRSVLILVLVLRNCGYGYSLVRSQGGGYDTDYHPAELHPPNADYSDEHAKQEQEKEPAAEKDSEKPLTGAKHADSKQASHAEGSLIYACQGLWQK